MQSLGILGGTFNPVHIGHLILAETALTVAHLDQVLWVPNHNPPHRRSTELLDPKHRVEMVKRAIADHPQFSLADVEAEGTAPGYAADTFQQLQQKFPSNQWSWILGLDAFKTLPQWHRRQEWITQCRWLVAPRRANADSHEYLDVECRQTNNRLQQQGINVTWQPLPVPLVDISSSIVRASCLEGRSIRYLVPDPVRLYIQQQSLYLSHPVTP